jgi:hypothetical protein
MRCVEAVGNCAKALGAGRGLPTQKAVIAFHFLPTELDADSLVIL